MAMQGSVRDCVRKLRNKGTVLSVRLGFLLQWEFQSITPSSLTVWMNGCISPCWVCRYKPESHLFLRRNKTSLGKLSFSQFTKWSCSSSAKSLELLQRAGQISFSFQTKTAFLRAIGKMLLRLVFPRPGCLWKMLRGRPSADCRFSPLWFLYSFVLFGYN